MQDTLRNTVECNKIIVPYFSIRMFIRRCSYWRYLISQNCRISAAYGDVTDGYGVSVQKIGDSVPSSPLKQTCTSLFLLFLCCTKGVEYGSLEALVSS